MLQLAESSEKSPIDITRDIPVVIGKSFIPTDFVVLETDSNLQLALIIGKLFLATSGAIIEVKSDNLIFNIVNGVIKFQLPTTNHMSILT